MLSTESLFVMHLHKYYMKFALCLWPIAEEQWAAITAPGSKYISAFGPTSAVRSGILSHAAGDHNLDTVPVCDMQINVQDRTTPGTPLFSCPYL